MIQVYETAYGIRVAEDDYFIDINEGDFKELFKVLVRHSPEKEVEKLVYTRYGTVEAGKIYPAEAIKPASGMVVINLVSNEVYQYWFIVDFDGTDRSRWISPVLDGNRELDNLPQGNYKVLFLGENK